MTLEEIVHRVANSYRGRKVRAFVRSWSPWYLRDALTTQCRWLADERGYLPNDYVNTAIEVLYRHAVCALEGHEDPADEATRYKVEGTTLVVDRRPR